MTIFFWFLAKIHKVGCPGCIIIGKTDKSTGWLAWPSTYLGQHAPGTHGPDHCPTRKSVIFRFPVGLPAWPDHPPDTPQMARIPLFWGFWPSLGVKIPPIWGFPDPIWTPPARHPGGGPENCRLHQSVVGNWCYRSGFLTENHVFWQRVSPSDRHFEARVPKLVAWSIILDPFFQYFGTRVTLNRTLEPEVPEIGAMDGDLRPENHDFWGRVTLLACKMGPKSPSSAL